MRGNRELLGRANKAHTPTVAAADAVVRAEARIVEDHVVRAVATVVRSRPVAAEGTDSVDRSPAPGARSRQEDCSCTFKDSPL